MRNKITNVVFKYLKDGNNKPAQGWQFDDDTINELRDKYRDIFESSSEITVSLDFTNIIVSGLKEASENNDSNDDDSFEQELLDWIEEDKHDKYSNL